MEPTHSGLNNIHRCLEGAVHAAIVLGAGLVVRPIFPHERHTHVSDGQSVDPFLFWDRSKLEAGIPGGVLGYAEWEARGNAITSSLCSSNEDQHRWKSEQISEEFLHQRVCNSSGSVSLCCLFQGVQTSHHEWWHNKIELILQPSQKLVDVSTPLIKALGQYSAMHVRRGDFFLSTSPQANISFEMIHRNVEKGFRVGEKVWIATDLRDPSQLIAPFQSPSARPTTIFTRDDMKDAFDSAYEAGGWYFVSAVEQRICVYARVFVGTLRSTWTERVDHLRRALGIRPSGLRTNVKVGKKWGR